MIQYTKAELLSLADCTPHDPLHKCDLTNNLKELCGSIKHSRTRKRGRKGGIRARVKRRGPNLHLPSIVLSNAQSIKNKKDELAARCKYISEYRNSSVICITESWLKAEIPDNHVTPDGFSIYRGDRTAESEKELGYGGVCLLVNKRWCTNVTIKEKVCTPKLELLTVSCRPFYLPREIPCVIFIIVYLPEGPHAPSEETVHDIISNAQKDKPEAAVIVLGDFNQEQFKVNGFTQYVTCNTRLDRKLDLCLTNIKNAYNKCYRRDPLGLSDHSTIVLLPTYLCKLKQEKPVTKTIKVWDDSTIDELQDCFDTTDWNSLYSEDVNECTDTVTSYIEFCESNIVKTKQVTCYPNNKPWINKELKEKLVQKRNLIYNKNRLQLKLLQKDLDQCITQCRTNYKNKLEEKFSEGNARQTWKGIQSITGHKKKSASFNNLSEGDSKKLCDDLNTFYTRFYTGANYNDLLNDLTSETCEPITITKLSVNKQFAHLNSRKAPGPDRISPLLLKSCHKELSGAYQHLYQLCVDKHIPTIWKTANIIPVPKKQNPKEHNDYRPIALTSVPFKCLERIIIDKLLPQINNSLDDNQFAYRKNKSTEDATLLLNHLITEHLDNKNTYVRSLFIDYSSAFNTIKPDIIVQKLKALKVTPALIKFILDFLSDRKQYVTINDLISDLLTINTGGPQGCVLSALLFIIYTNDLRSHSANCRLIKYADDTVIVGLITGGQDNDYIKEITEAVNWCGEHNLLLNVKKTKELIFDFRINTTPRTPIVINDSPVDICESIKYLGVTFDNKLKWSNHISHLISKCKQRLYFLRVLNSFHVNQDLLHLFYTTMVQSVLCYNLVSWWSVASSGDKISINRIRRQASKITRTNLPLVDVLYTNQVVNKVKWIKDQDLHPLESYYQTMRSGTRLRAIPCRTQRYRKSFVPNSIHLFNSDT